MVADVRRTCIGVRRCMHLLAKELTREGLVDALGTSYVSKPGQSQGVSDHGGKVAAGKEVSVEP